MRLSGIQLDNQKKILILIFFVLMAYLDYGFILKAQRAALGGLESKVVKLKADLANLNAGLENMRASKARPAAPVQKKVSGSSKIISEGRVSELLEEISTAANKFDIKIAQIRPLRQTQKEKSTLVPERLTPLLINLDLVCDYHNLGRFIQVLENAPVFMGVEELKISTQLPDYMKQKVTLALKTYVSK